MRVFLSCAPAVARPNAAITAKSAAITRFMPYLPWVCLAATGYPMGPATVTSRIVPGRLRATHDNETRRQGTHGPGDRRPQGSLSGREARGDRARGRAEARQAGVQRHRPV